MPIPFPGSTGYPAPTFAEQASSARLAQLEREVAELREMVLAALGGASPAAASVTGLVTLDTFAAALGRATKTIANDLTSPDPARRQRWPEFRKAGGGWATTLDEVRRWWSRGKSSGLAPEVLTALAEVDAGRRRAVR